MIRHTELLPRFVKVIPRKLGPGVLYVSTEYGTAVHSCCCGCGQEVVTPLTPTDWRLTIVGETISLWPSIGNWNLPCRSHYVIKRNRVIEAGSWGKARIEAEQKKDKAAKAKFYAQAADPVQSKASQPMTATPNRDAPQGFWAKLWLRLAS
ncbi:MAG: DUF6527 family protein [Pseudomonadota bacterium]